MHRVSITRQALRISTIEGSWAAVHFVITSGAFLTGFALMLGADDYQLALLAAIPVLLQVFQLPGAYLVEKTGWRKGAVGWFAVVGRTLWLPMALLPFLYRGNAVVAFLWIYAVASLAMNAGAPGWVAWMSAIVPGRIRGRYFGTRNRIGGLVSIVAGLVAGVLLDLFRDHGAERLGYLALQVIAVATGLVCFHLIRKQPDPDYRAETIPPLGRYLAQPMRDPDFRKIVVFNLYWLFAVGIASPFFNAHLIKHLQWDFKSLALNGAIVSVMTIVFLPMWGRLVDRYGHKPVLTVTTAGILHLPFYYAFCPWDVRWPIFANAALSGILWGGFGLAAFNLLMHKLPPGGRSLYVAVFAALNGLMMFLASMLSGWLAEMLAGLHWQFGRLTVVNYQILFIMTGLLRVPGLLLLRRIHEPEAHGARVLIRKMFIELNKRIGLGRHVYPYP